MKPCPIFKPFHPPYIKLKSLSLHFFLFYKVLPFSLTKQTIVVQAIAFQTKLHGHRMFIKTAIPTHVTKNI